MASHSSAAVVEPAAQRVAYGLHSPVHWPAPLQTFVQAVCAWFVPVASHRYGVWLSPQLRVCGSQLPPHAVVAPEPLQTYWQVVVSRQIPSRSHCWITGPLGLQRLSFGVQPLPHIPVASSHSGAEAGQAV